MNNKTLTIAALLAAALLAGIFSTTTPMAAYADDTSETETNQKIEIDANGSGNANIGSCADNDINSPEPVIAVTDCNSQTSIP